MLVKADALAPAAAVQEKDDGQRSGRLGSRQVEVSELRGRLAVRQAAVRRRLGQRGEVVAVKKQHQRARRAPSRRGAAETTKGSKLVAWSTRGLSLRGIWLENVGVQPSTPRLKSQGIKI